MYMMWRCRRELHPRMGVLQTPALLLGYGTDSLPEYQNY